MCIRDRSTAELLVPQTAFAAPAPLATSARDVYRQVARARPGDTITLPAGVTTLDRPLAVPRGVTLQGDRRGTVLRIARRAADAFGYSFMIGPSEDSRNVTVRDISLDGSRSRGIPDNSGGGIKAGPSWTISGIHLSNMSYFKIWVYRVADVEVRRNVFDASFGVSSGHDNIGGGRSRRVTLGSNTFDASTRGNAIDLVAPRDVTIADNTVTGAPGREHSCLLYTSRCV